MAADLIIMGNIQLELGQYDKALNSFMGAVKAIESSDLDQKVKDNARRAFLYNSARINLMTGDISTAKEKAKKHLASTTELGNPFQIWLSHELAGMIALEEKDYSRAIEELAQANQQNPYNHYRLALAYTGKGASDKARTACETAANYNALNNLNYAFIRNKAEKMLASF
jgi:tetratricopeptide (TPR) repeat protein